MKIIAYSVLINVAIWVQNPEYNAYGLPISEEGSIQVSSMVSQVEEEPKSFKVKGVVEEVCQMKGCWMILQGSNEEIPVIRVTFKDYGFFVPKNISGKTVIVQGLASQEKLSEEDARHYAEDANKAYNPSIINQISFVAEGVLVEVTQE